MKLFMVPRINGKIKLTLERNLNETSPFVSNFAPKEVEKNLSLRGRP